MVTDGFQKLKVTSFFSGMAEGAVSGQKGLSVGAPVLAPGQVARPSLASFAAEQ
jgi:hypothetical protein